jgi:orotate phosphoribosyltransferase
MNIKKIYEENQALLKGHFKLSSGKHSEYYLQSARVLENPAVAEEIMKELAKQIKESGIKIDSVCSPAIGGLLAGYELARQLGVRFIFAERVNGKMTIRRGFEVKDGEKVLICEDIITTGGSALETATQIEENGGDVVAFAAIANRGYCKREGSDLEVKSQCKLPSDIPLFALEDFVFETYEADECPMCKTGSKAIKPGSRGN